MLDTGSIIHSGLYLVNNLSKNRFLTVMVRQKKNVSGYPTDPYILGPTQTFLRLFGLLKSNFKLF